MAVLTKRQMQEESERLIGSLRWMGDIVKFRLDHALTHDEQREILSEYEEYVDRQAKNLRQRVNRDGYNQI